MTVKLGNITTGDERSRLMPKLEQKWRADGYTDWIDFMVRCPTALRTQWVLEILESVRGC